MHIVELSKELKATIPDLRAYLSTLEGDLASRGFQERVQETLMGYDVWREWIEQSRTSLTEGPVLLRAGLQLTHDDATAHRLLVGLARSWEPRNYVPPYAVDNRAVTEVIAQPGTSRESHSMNDLPAAPHTAGFFEPVPNHSCYFACIRPHPGGGGETTVLDLDAVFAKASPECIAEWTEKTYFLRTSKRLGTETKPFQLLRWIEGTPFLRYRKEYTVGFDEDSSLRELERLVCDTKNHHVALLQPDEIIMHWNGAPHSRLPQQGATPDDIAQRRKLIRCRTQPYAGWERYFT